MKCPVCEDEFTPKDGEQRYCSAHCRNVGNSRSTAAQRGDTLRDRGEGKSYRKRGGRHEHRVVAEEKLGRALLSGEIVHHIDGDKRNNDPENLEVITQSEHARRHAAERRAEQPAIDCSAEECKRPAKAKGMCLMHYQRAHKGKEVMPNA